MVMAVPYTQGTWQVKAGHAEEFVAGWIEFAEWTSANVDGAGHGVLLRDLSDDHRFVSVGPWESLDAIERWRALPGWAERVAKLRDLLERFEPATLEMVAERG
jgi:heme-degrading monooxygenase HmoA